MNADYDFLLRALHGDATYAWADVDVARFNADGRHIRDVAFLRKERQEVRMHYISPLRYSVGALAHNLRHKTSNAAAMLGLSGQA